MKHIVGFSGGVDSQACALWARRRYPAEDVILLNSDAGGNEHPITTAFIEEYSAKHHPVVTVQAEIQDLGDVAKAAVDRLQLEPTDRLTFDLLAKLKGIFPANGMQFCTEYLKIRPAMRWMRENLGQPGFPDDPPDYERYVGVRRDESKRRRDYPERQWDDTFGCWLNAPLVEWSKDQCFAYCREAGEEINPLYLEGFSRVGCAPCINPNKDDIRRWAARHPEMIDKVRGWEQQVGRTFYTAILPGGRWGGIDAVVDWSRTARGGKQFSLPIIEAEADAGLCENKWGFCE